MFGLKTNPYDIDSEKTLDERLQAIWKSVPNLSVKMLIDDASRTRRTYPSRVCICGVFCFRRELRNWIYKDIRKSLFRMVPVEMCWFVYSHK